MFFRKKSKEDQCRACGKYSSHKYNFCPYCGTSMLDQFEETVDFGMLGKKDIKEEDSLKNNIQSGEFKILDRIISSVMSNMVKSMMSEIKDPQVKQTPNSINIKIGPQGKSQKREERKVTRSISEDQIKKMADMPRTTAKTAVKRLSDKIVYELNIPGIASPEDIFISKLESGYEIKAIGGNKKVYVNSLPVNLPIKSLAINADKLYVEFRTEEDNFRQN